ncbi:mitochondrial inner membrane protease subunit 2 isoform X16 [Bubalus kerabau]|uniref:mitochondrial inner membrane protease subunit 2 isoform X16 n=1 Tax=Bubalus carabanensis TaxID=3119969 RepID=UPI00244EDDC7|nr:mitochondrial inner membrane protease subunit 2 isoform X16 [Bubalus carabanensis]
MDSTPVSREGPRVAYSLIWAFGDSKQSTQLNLPDCSPGGWLIQSPSLSFLSHTANSRWLSIVHMVISPKNPEQKIIKRVIALEGDIVKTMGHKNRYVKVPRGHIWVEGDHHGHSFDSNSFGPHQVNVAREHCFEKCRSWDAIWRISLGSDCERVLVHPCNLLSSKPWISALVLV